MAFEWKRFGKAVTAFRDGAALDQQTFAARSRVNASTVSRVEHGKSCSVEMALRLAHYCGTDLWRFWVSPNRHKPNRQRHIRRGAHVRS